LIDAIVFVHAVLARALLLFAGLLGIWGTYLYFRRSAVTGGFRSSFDPRRAHRRARRRGLVVLAAGHRPTEILHVVYGIFAVLSSPASTSTRMAEPPARGGLLARAAWIVSVAFFRGFATG
jgi:hypothetical protein